MELEESMNNKGQVTVFISLIISVMLVLGMTAHKAIRVNLVQEKCVINTRSIVSSVMSEYDSYIFDNYHILLFDKKYDGISEEEKEEQLKRLLQENLGDNITVDNVDILGYKYLLDNDCDEFKNQISEYMSYAFVEYSFEEILEKLKGGDVIVKEETLEAMEEAKNQEEVDEATEAETDDMLEKNEEEVEDPREFTASIQENGVLSLVLPENMEISDVHIDLSEVPSGGNGTKFDEIDSNFCDIDCFMNDLDINDGWIDEIEGDIEGVLYSRLVFNCATACDVNPSTVFKCEREYLIAGKSSDKKNLESVVLRISALRFPVNFIYLITDTEKLSLIEPIAEALFLATGVPAPVYQYLIAGCWSYIESLAEVKSLLKGECLEFIKTKENWITDLNNLEDSINGGKSTEEGLSYEDYLMILAAMNTDDIYIRMLDLIQLNREQSYSDFRIKNAAVWITIQTDCEYQGKKYLNECSDGY